MARRSQKRKLKSRRKSTRRQSRRKVSRKSTRRQSRRKSRYLPRARSVLGGAAALGTIGAGAALYKKRNSEGVGGLLKRMFGRTATVAPQVAPQPPPQSVSVEEPSLPQNTHQVKSTIDSLVKEFSISNGDKLVLRGKAFNNAMRNFNAYDSILLAVNEMDITRQEIKNIEDNIEAHYKRNQV